jgi:hypothetical protein
LVNTLLHRLWPDLNCSLVQVGLPGANAGKFTVATLAKNYTFWSGYFSLRQARKIKRL